MAPFAQSSSVLLAKRSFGAYNGGGGELASLASRPQQLCEEAAKMSSNKKRLLCPTRDALNAESSYDLYATTSTHRSAEEQYHLESSVPIHPLRVKPLGNLYSTDNKNIKSRCGTFSFLSDELLLHLLELMQAPDLVRLGQTCKALYAFCRHDEVWRTLFIEHSPATHSWRGSWRTTYLNAESVNFASISCAGLYSDALYRPYYCANTPLESYTRNIPARNTIPRLDDMSHSVFASDGWVDKPFILIDPVKRWPAYSSWSKERLLHLHANTKFRAEALDWPLRTYADYMDNNNDESPLYLFDSHFQSKVGSSTTAEPAYRSPTAFGYDLFDHLGNLRPNNKWLILGPDRSGSSFHKDPNGTSAWNAVLRGSKYWLMFPSKSATGKALPPPPGIFLSKDGSEVTSPLSIAEYILSFHEAARATMGCREGICHEGEVLHVPSGWFHLVMNLGESLAITQNFVPEAHLEDVLLFLRDTPEQISGFHEVKNNDVHELFVRSLQDKAPEALRQALERMKHAGKGEPTKCSKWQDMTTTSARGFSFGFGIEDVHS